MHETVEGQAGGRRLGVMAVEHGCWMDGGGEAHISVGKWIGVGGGTGG